jgi:hypothetical protein
MNYQDQLKFWNEQIGNDGQEPVEANNSPAVDVPAQPVQTLTIQESLDALAPVSHIQYTERTGSLIASSVRHNVNQMVDARLLAETPNNNQSFWAALCLALKRPLTDAEIVAQYFSTYIVENVGSIEVEQYITRLLDEDRKIHSKYLRGYIKHTLFNEYKQSFANINMPDNVKNRYAWAIGAINATFIKKMGTVQPVIEFVTYVLSKSNIHMFVYDFDNDMHTVIGWWPTEDVDGEEVKKESAKCICLFKTEEHYFLINMVSAPVAPGVMMGGAVQDFKRAKLIHNTSANDANYANTKTINIDTAYGNQRQLKDTNELRGGVTHRIAKHTKHTKHAEPVRSSAVGLYKSAVAAWRHACMITSQPTSPFARFSKHCRPTDMTDFEKYVDWAYRHVVLQGLAMPTELAGKHDKLVAKYVGADLSANLVLKECRTLVVEIMAGKAVFRYLATTDVPTFCWLVSPGLYKLASQVFSNNSNHSDYSDQTSQARWLAKQAKTTKLFDRQDHKAGPTELVQTKQLVSTNKQAGQLPVLWLDKSTSRTKQTKQTEETVHDFKRAKHAHPNHTSHKWQAVLYCQDRKAVSSQLAFANQSKAAQLPNLAAMLAKMPGFFWKDLLGWQSKQIDFELLAKLVMIG